MFCLLAISGTLSFLAVIYTRIKQDVRKKAQAWKDFAEAVKPWLHTDDK